MSRRTLIALAAVLLVQSVVVALVFTPQPHSGGDNAGYISLAHSLLENGSYRELWDPSEPKHTKYPPVFSVLLASAILLGAKSWGALKLVPAFSVVLAAAFTFLWAKGRTNLSTGVAVALLLGLSESVVYYSQWVLSDPTFLALTMAGLWAFHRSSRGGEGEPEDPAGTGRGGTIWLGIGMAMVVLAYFTRSAGLPLAVATLLWLGLQRRWKALVVFAALFGIPALLWWIRARSVGGSEYVSEFWLVDPYQPHLGTVGFSGLMERVGENLNSYLFRIVPAGIVGDDVPLLPAFPLGLGLALVALVGWIRSLVRRVGPAELFLPLYFGLILLWPQPWSGDRFALPLLPLLFYYCCVALQWLLASFPLGGRRAAGVVLFLILAVPAGHQWSRMVAEAGSCRDLTRDGRARECLTQAQGEYFALAEWAGRSLPDDASVTTRKPRIFFLMSGVKTHSIPLLADPDEFVGRIRGSGSRYVSLDLLDGVSGYYVYPALRDRISSFCGLVEVGQMGTQLLGILPTGPGVPPEGGGEILVRCPGEMMRSSPRGERSVQGWEIPLLAW